MSKVDLTRYDPHEAAPRPAEPDNVAGTGVERSGLQPEHLVYRLMLPLSTGSLYRLRPSHRPVTHLEQSYFSDQPQRSRQRRIKY
jgi:hypothetical protein